MVLIFEFCVLRLAFLTMLHLNLNNFFQKSIGPLGITLSEWQAGQKIARSVFADVEQKRGKAGYGFMNLAYQDRSDLEPNVQLKAKTLNQFDTLVVLGIGGSIMGAKMIDAALHPYFYPSLKRQNSALRLFFVGDTTEPDQLFELLSLINPKTTLFNIVSKSGETIETLANFLVLQQLVKEEITKDYHQHFIVTTGSGNSSLREIATQENYAILDIPKNVAGRFSALTSVGLFPAVCSGIDIEALLRGAREMDEMIIGEKMENPALHFALVQYLANTKKDRVINALMPYTKHLYYFGLWWKQLWAETLGKEYDLNGNEVRVGLTPILSMGPSDQHSQLQLYNEGPLNKTVTLIKVQETKKDFTLPQKLTGNLAYLSGKKLSQILLTEEKATQETLTTHGQFNCTITLPQLDEENMGALIYFFEMAVVYLANFYQINPFNQPGVESSKRRIKKILSNE